GTVWPDVVVEEGNLSKLVFLLRRQLDDDEAVETVPKRGYRFTAPVRLLDQPDAPRAEAAAAEDRSVAVMPFADLSPDHSQRHLCDGRSEQILNRLAAIPQLKVVARAPSVFLGKRVEGSVRKSDDRLRIT